MKINIKPLSVNECWQGRRFKTPNYKAYEQEILLLLPQSRADFSGDLKIEIEFGFSSKNADLDNPTKPFLDILQKKYGFNDSQVSELILRKKIVKKGEEFISFDIRK